ncbi:unnamed protein product [Arctogadus glacialis]
MWPSLRLLPPGRAPQHLLHLTLSLTPLPTPPSSSSSQELLNTSSTSPSPSLLSLLLPPPPPLKSSSTPPPPLKSSSTPPPPHPLPHSSPYSSLHLLSRAPQHLLHLTLSLTPLPTPPSFSSQELLTTAYTPPSL